MWAGTGPGPGKLAGWSWLRGIGCGDHVRSIWWAGVGGLGGAGGS